MKKVFLILCTSLLLAQNGNAQKGFTIGANVLPMNSNIVVQDTWGNGHEFEYAATFNTSYGLDLGYNISDQIGVSTGYWFMDLGQNYEDQWNGSDWERKLNLEYQVIPITLKFNGNKSKFNFLGGIGVLFASLKQADQEWLRDGSTYMEIIESPITGNDFNLGEEDVTDRFNESDILLHLDVGTRWLLGENLYIDATLSFGYGLKDINHPDWQIPDSDGSYEPSHNAYGGLKVGLAYVLFGQ